MPSTAQLFAGPSAIPPAQSKGQGAGRQTPSGDEAFSLLLQAVEEIAAEATAAAAGQPTARQATPPRHAMPMLQGDLAALTEGLVTIGSSGDPVTAEAEVPAASLFDPHALRPLPETMTTVETLSNSDLPGEAAAGALKGDRDGLLQSLTDTFRDRGARKGEARQDVRGPELRPLPAHASAQAHDQRALLEAKLEALAQMRDDRGAGEAGKSAPELGKTQGAETAAKLDVTAQAQAASETSNPVVRQVAQNLQYVVRQGLERLRIDLFPEELGRVQVQLQKSGTVTRLTIVAESPQAFEALQRGAGGLQFALQQSGFDADEMVFEQHRDDQPERDGEKREDGRSRRDEQHADDRREVFFRLATERTPFA
ncbi:MAG: flagellar hook-length control protein FliK [Parvularcula sp.]|jgi:hypothetical protein|nr:flagellar hook-length control protein FliK [Parvularcula sp.]